MKGGPFGKGRSRGGSPQGAVFLGEGRSRGGARRGAAPFGGAESHVRSAWSPPQAGGLRRSPGFFANRGRGGFAPLPPGFCAGSWRPGRPFEMGKAGDDPPFLRRQEPRGEPGGGGFPWERQEPRGEPAGAQPLSAEPKATREARGARRRRAGCARMPPARGRGRRKIHPRRGQHGDIFSAIQRQQRQ